MLDALISRTDRLLRQLAEASAAMVVEAGVLREGMPPSSEILQALEACRAEAEAVRGETAAALGVSVAEIPASVADCQAKLVEARDAALLSERIQAITVLSRVGRLTHTTAVDFQPLLAAQQRAAFLAANLESNVDSGDLRGLADGTHPLCALLSLVDGGVRLDESEWERLRARVAEAIDPKLAAAAAMGHLAITLPNEEPAVQAPEPEGGAPVEHTGVNGGEADGSEESRDASGVARAESEVARHGEPEPAVEPPVAELDAVKREDARKPTPPPAKPSSQGPWPRAVWAHIGAGRPALAAHLAAASGITGMPSPALLKALALAPHLARPYGDVAEALQACYGDLGPLSTDRSIHLLAWAASVRASLIAPVSGAVGVLRGVRLGEGLDSLHRFTQGLLDVVERVGLQGFSLANLKGAYGHLAWDEQIRGIQAETAAWQRRASTRTVIYARATEVWKQWNRQGGPIDRMLEPIREGNIDGASEVKRWVQGLVDRDELRALVDETDRRLYVGKSNERIHSKAFEQLLAFAGEGAQLANRWLALVGQRPDRSDFIAQQAEGLKRQLDEDVEDAQRELCDLVSAEGRLGTAARCVLNALSDLRSAFDPEVAAPGCEVPVRCVLNGDLLRFPDVDLDDEWQVETPPASLAAILGATPAGMVDWAAAFEARVARRDLLGAGFIVECLNATGDSLADELRQRYERALDQHRDALRRDLAHARNELERALTNGFIEGADRAGLDAMLVEQEQRLEAVRRFDRAHAEITEVRDLLTTYREEKCAGALAELQRLGLAPDDVSATRVRSAIQAGDIMTANEYIERLRAGEPLPSELPPDDDPFAQFFPHTANAISVFLEKAGDPAAVSAVRRRSDLAGLPLPDLTQDQAESAAAMIEAWFTLKRHRPDDEAVRRVLRGIGFNPLAVNVRKIGEKFQVEVKVEVVADRTVCPVPAFGSLAAGLYRIICLRDQPTADEIVAAVGETAHRAQATLVFYHGRLSEPRRRELARLCREQNRSFLVLDDTLMVFLAAEKRFRLATMFRCTLPFTFSRPYVTTTSAVPPEMFYGRQVEQDALANVRSVSSFVYGGRQLGKSALLRQVERSFNSPNDGQFAMWIDLKTAEVGIYQPASMIWAILARELAQRSIVNPRTADQVPESGPERLIGELEGWLSGAPRRRILVLLDEADAFLTQDGKDGYRQSQRLKALMDRTERRFKVVFAGLHNVLRTTEQSNHPLAHLGDPIVIGPLLHNSEWRAARALVTEPLRALGYRFESEDLITRILAQANYYPSLIQLGCDQLLQALVERSRGTLDERSAPPYTITHQLVEETFQSDLFRKAMRQRFLWTLQLDSRYELVAYALAWHFVAKGASMSAGLPAQLLKDEVLARWPAGFRGLRDHEFTVLLEEMEGLGVLRRVGRDSYTLRSPNLVLLMGSQDEIDSTLRKEREPAPVFEPGTYHARGKPEDPKRHPLTFEQRESFRKPPAAALIVFGTEAAGITDLVPFLQSDQDIGTVVPLEKIRTRAELRQRLASAAKRAQATGSIVVAVRPTLQLREAWISDAIDVLSTAPRICLKLLIVADPRAAWDGYCDVARKVSNLSVLVLGHWDKGFARQWLEDMNIPNHDDAHRRIHEVTGDWPALLFELHRRFNHDRPIDDSLAMLSEELADDTAKREWMRLFGLDIEPARDGLKLLGEMIDAQGCFTREDLLFMAEAEGTEVQSLERVVHWATDLALLNPEGPDQWRFDPVVRMLLGL
jgi:hypothetical protein